ncbi:Hypothetical_protein [Hexamita inflata]|uniref:Hypothetical_protein n=1 Tax=Hexamita inflata TaxID=28002 RepID=A0AA86PHD1_9EUKA|nr:Hypothetical protein HINF_LOCUS24893 [Hexamita inflata]
MCFINTLCSAHQLAQTLRTCEIYFKNAMTSESHFTITDQAKTTTGVFHEFRFTYLKQKCVASRASVQCIFHHRYWEKSGGVRSKEFQAWSQCRLIGPFNLWSGALHVVAIQNKLGLEQIHKWEMNDVGRQANDLKRFRLGSRPQSTCAHSQGCDAIYPSPYFRVKKSQTPSVQSKITRLFT